VNYPKAQQLTFALGFVALITNVAVALYYAGTPESLPGIFFTLLFVAWSGSPYLFFLFASRVPDQSASTVGLILVVAIIVCAGGVWALIDTAFIHRDPFGPALPLFLPLWQWMLLLIVLTVNYFREGRNAT